MSDERKQQGVLVVGATGLLGAEITSMLVAAGHRVRALVRKAPEHAYSRPDLRARRSAVEALPVETVHADLRDAASLEAVCQGVSAVVSTATAVASPRPEDSIEAVDHRGQLALVSAAERAGVRHMTFVSFLPNALDYEFQKAKRRVEGRLRESALTHTILQATAFMEVWLGPAVGFDPPGGRARVFGGGENPVSWVSAHDVARFAASSVNRERFWDKTLAVAGPEALSPRAVLDIFRGLGAPECSVQMVPEAALEAQLADAKDARQEALAAGALLNARGQVVTSSQALDLLPGRLVTVRAFAAHSLQRHQAGTLAPE